MSILHICSSDYKFSLIIWGRHNKKHGPQNKHKPQTHFVRVVFNCLKHEATFSLPTIFNELIIYLPFFKDWKRSYKWLPSFITHSSFIPWADPASKPWERETLWEEKNSPETSAYISTIILKELTGPFLVRIHTSLVKIIFEVIKI